MDKRHAHYHRCSECGKIWHHGDARFGDKYAHTCPAPGCGGEAVRGWAMLPARKLTPAERKGSVQHPKEDEP